MYNNTIIQTNYKPYIPPPKKKVAQNPDDPQKQQPQGRVISPNDYDFNNQQRKNSSDTFQKQYTPPAKINISQLLIDFNSTLNAIGASNEVEQEVKTYLTLIENQANKDNPNKKMIVSNLKIAADVLDAYISDALNKPSKVVKDWIEALLLQNIDYKADKTLTKGAFESITGEAPQTAKLAEQKLAQKTSQTQEQIQINDKDSIEKVIPEDNSNIPIANEDILILISKADKEVVPKEALKILSEAFLKAQEQDDKLSMAKIYSKIGSVQNSVNNLPLALDCLNASTKLAYIIGDNELKTYNHKQMGGIYDDAGMIDIAMSHYFASIAIDGLLDDTNNQADTLNSIAKMHTVRYEKNNAINFYKDALELAKVKTDIVLMGDIFKNTALTYKNAGDNQNALKNFKTAATLTQKSGDGKNLAEIYEQAADLMLQMNCKNKALDLYKKSYRLAEKNSDLENLSKLKEKLMKLK